MQMRLAEGVIISYDAFFRTVDDEFGYAPRLRKEIQRTVYGGKIDVLQCAMDQLGGDRCPWSLHDP